MKKLLFLIIAAILLYSCASTHKAGVIYEGKKGRWVLGNGKHRQEWYDKKYKHDSLYGGQSLPIKDTIF